MSSNSTGKNDFISLPKGGGAINGMGEKFSPDLFTGTGNFSLLISIPKGRNNFQPELTLQYSTGNSNGILGLGWALSVPGVSRSTSKGVPSYNDCKDVFVLSGFEDLVEVGMAGKAKKFRPRTEGVFAEILFHKYDNHSYWEIKNKNGLVSYYGQPGKKENDESVIYDPDDHAREFSWKMTQTKDPFNNNILYSYLPVISECNGEKTEEVYLDKIEYINIDNNKFLVSVKFYYEDRDDILSGFKSGFEIRTNKRVKSIEIISNDINGGVIKKYVFSYSNDSFNKVSLLKQVQVLGLNNNSELAPLNFKYSEFNPELHENKKLVSLKGTVPQLSLKNPKLELIDLDGNGLPDFVLFDKGITVFKNKGQGIFEYNGLMQQSPAVDLSSKNFNLLDADGDGRAEILQSENTAIYFPLDFNGKWNFKERVQYSVFPNVDLKSPNVRLLDLTGDGITDIIQTEGNINCFFNNEEPSLAWKETKFRSRTNEKNFPNVSFSDSRVKTADMNGDGLQDIVFIEKGKISYWPGKGHGEWGDKCEMKNSPGMPDFLEMNRVLLGDIDGDGLADLVFVENNRIRIFINQSGKSWSNEILVTGTPPFANQDDVRIVDLLGFGVSGILWSSNKRSNTPSNYHYLDLTGTVKPYLFTEMDNGIGAITKVQYGSSTHHYLNDLQNRFKWKTHLPFPVLTVNKVEVIDKVSKSKLVTTYKYHHGHFDGQIEREFRGFGLVEQFDSESFNDYHKTTVSELNFNVVEEKYFTPPTHTKTWFHIGPVKKENGEWTTAEFDDEFYTTDANVFINNAFNQTELFKLKHRRQQRDMLRALHGKTLRQEFYSGKKINDSTVPFSVKEFNYDIRVEFVDDNFFSKPVIFPFAIEQRETIYEAGDDLLNRISITSDYDAFGQPQKTSSFAFPRREKFRANTVAKNYNEELDESKILATHAITKYCTTVKAGVFIKDRIGEIKSFSLLPSQSNFVENDNESISEILRQQSDSARDLHQNIFAPLNRNKLKLEGHTLNYYDGLKFEGRELGVLDTFGVVVRSETLAFTNDILNDAYVIKQNDNRLPVYLNGNAPVINNTPVNFGTNAGYSFLNIAPYETGHYIIAVRNQYDFHTNLQTSKGLLESTKDALGNDATVAYDNYLLLPSSVTDAVGNKTQAIYDYRFFLPVVITDVNNNKDKIEYSELGLPLKIYKEGNNGEGGTAAKPDIEFTYKLKYNDQTGQPIFVETVARVEHASSNAGDQIIHSREYSDGLGRLIQKRTQSDDVMFGIAGDDVGLNSNQSGSNTPAVGIQNNSAATPSVVVSGWQVFNNKSLVVESYEPFYSTGYEFEPEVFHGVRSEIYYDAIGRQQKIINPDGSQQIMIYGSLADVEQPDLFRPSPWEKYVYDANDLEAGNPHQHTPASVITDALGRMIAGVNRNDARDKQKWFVTKTIFDIKGNPLEIYEAKNRAAFIYHYDLLNRVLRIDSIDAGKRTKVYDATGNIIEYRDDKGSVILKVYDKLNRPNEVWVCNDNFSKVLQLSEDIYYGDETNITPNPQSKNLLGKIFRHFDEAGVTEFSQYDFKGNLLVKDRKIIDHALIGREIDWNANPQPAIDDIDYVTAYSYDALNRIKQVTYPQCVNGNTPILKAEYNPSGKLRKVIFDSETYVEHIAYNAKSQRILIAYGNNVMTRYVYDTNTFRLLRLRTESFQQNNPAFEFISGGSVLQDFAYEYDLTGNILSINHTESESGEGGSDELKRVFTYDAIYRLLSATGREAQQPRQAPGDFLFGLNTADPTLTKSYIESYEYDEAGNFLFLKHKFAKGNNRVREFTNDGNSNRMQTVSFGGDDFNYIYDANGNLIEDGNSRSMFWDHSDRLINFEVHDSNNVTKQGEYHYDAAGNRIIKKRTTIGSETITIYIDGIFEHCIDKTQNIENNTLHIMDNQNCIAIKRVGDNMGDTKPPVQYHLGDHLGSSNITIGGNDASRKAKISKEEYSPYGETTFGDYSFKRYRYSSKERDEESGMYYYGVRYYLPWVCRWGSCDPIGIKGGLNLFSFVNSNPNYYKDKYGMEGEKADPVQNLVENIQKRYEQYVLELQKGNPEISNQDLGRRAGEMVESDIEDIFGKGSAEVNYSKLKSEHTIDISLKGYDIDVELKLSESSERVLQKRVFVDFAAKEKRVLAFVNKDGYWIVDFGAKKLSPKVLKDIQAKTKKFNSIFVNASKKAGKLIEAIPAPVKNVAKGLGAAAPLIGTGAGLVSMELNLFEGKYAEATLDAVGLVPVVGDALDVGRAGGELLNYAFEDEFDWWVNKAVEATSD